MSAIKGLVRGHPLITAWVALAIGMVVLLLIFAPRDAGLLPTQMAALIVSTIVLAGLCVWIVSWE